MILKILATILAIIAIIIMLLFIIACEHLNAELRNYEEYKDFMDKYEKDIRHKQ